MSAIIRASFRVLTLLCAACMCLITAHTVNHVLDAWLEPLPLPRAEPAKQAPTREEIATPLALAPLSRYLGLPDQVRTQVIAAPSTTNDAAPNSLGLKLLGTMVTVVPTTSFASVYEAPTQRTVSVWTGGEIQGAQVLAIERTYVLVSNGGRLEYISPTTGTGSGASTPPTSAPASQPTTIRRLSETTFEFSRQEMNESLARLNEVAMQARIVPAFVNGVPKGFKLFSIRPDSVYARLGLQNGDVLQRINGLTLDSVEHSLEAYSHLREWSRIDLDVERNGQPLHHTYTIRD